jgi:hypothetical protein
LHATEPFVITEEEELVLDDATTNGGTELILTKSCFLLRGRLEEVTGIEYVVAEEFSYGPVQAIGA